MAIAGKVAMITGGAGGLGRAFAMALLQANASVVCLVDISRNGKEAALELGRKFTTSHVDFYHCDVTNYNLFKGAFDFMTTKYGGIDIVCNNAGMASMDADIEGSIKTMRINLEAVYFGTQLGMEYMDKDRGRPGGVIVNIASMAAFLPIENAMAYTGSKAGVIGVTQSASTPKSFEMFGVRVNALCPSFAETAIIDSVAGMRESIAQIPGHFILEPSYVAEGFMQLVQDDSLNGAIMRVTPQKGIDFYGRRRSRKPTPTESKL